VASKSDDDASHTPDEYVTILSSAFCCKKTTDEAKAIILGRATGLLLFLFYTFIRGKPEQLI